MRSDLRFRAAHQRPSISELPRTPRSPRGVYTGEPVPLRNSRSSRYCAVAVGLFVTALLSTAYLFLEGFSPPEFIARSRPSLRQGWSSGPTLLGQFVPSFPVYEFAFQDNLAFQRRDKEGEGAWASLFPFGGGSVAVENPREYGLPPSVNALDSQGNNITDIEILLDYEAHIAPMEERMIHTFHCLDHVRQAILCASDTSLEPISEPLSKRKAVGLSDRFAKAAFGFQATQHTCKNWAEVKGWIERNRPTSA